VFTAAIAGSVYAKQGTTIDTRLTVIDKAPAEPVACISIRAAIIVLTSIRRPRPGRR
jgi:hypothetical protein